MLKLTSLVVVASILFSGCVSSTLIQSSPPGAKVYIDGEPMGVTPYWHADSKITGSITNVDLVKEGYEPLYAQFAKTEQVNVGAIVGGLFIWPIFLWSLEYKPTHSFELLPLATTATNTPTINDSTLTVAPQTPEEQVQTVSPKVQRLRELKQLLDENLISKEDFEKQKQKILDEK